MQQLIGRISAWAVPRNTTSAASCHVSRGCQTTDSTAQWVDAANDSNISSIYSSNVPHCIVTVYSFTLKSHLFSSSYWLLACTKSAKHVPMSNLRRATLQQPRWQILYSRCPSSPLINSTSRQYVHLDVMINHSQLSLTHHTTQYSLLGFCAT